MSEVKPNHIRLRKSIDLGKSPPQSITLPQWKLIERTSKTSCPKQVRRLWTYKNMWGAF